MINRIKIPVITDQALEDILKCLKPRKLTRDCNLFDVGYETARRDLLDILCKHTNVTNATLADQLLAEVQKRKDEN